MATVSANVTQWNSYISEAAKAYNVSEYLIRAVIQCESGGNPKARSSAGAMGLMQLMPGTARSLGVSNAYDPRQNIMGGTRYLAGCIKTFNGDWRRAVAGYNWGPGRASLKKANWESYLPKETRNYLARVSSYLPANFTTNYSGLPSGDNTIVTGSSDTSKAFLAQDRHNIEKWGLLRYFEEVQSESIGEVKAQALLNLYNRKTRSLVVKGAFGVTSVRPGCLVPTLLNLGDIELANYMLVNKITHTFSNDDYKMEMTLDGIWDE